MILLFVAYMKGKNKFFCHYEFVITFILPNNISMATPLIGACLLSTDRPPYQARPCPSPIDLMFSDMSLDSCVLPLLSITNLFWVKFSEALFSIRINYSWHYNIDKLTYDMIPAQFISPIKMDSILFKIVS